MKLRNLFFIVSVFFVGCSSPKEQLIKEAETYLKSTLNDPKSYERVTFLITDTVTELKFRKRVDSMDIANVDFYMGLSKRDLENLLSLQKQYKDVGEKILEPEFKRTNNEIDSLNKAKEVYIQRDDSIKKIIVDNSQIKYIYFFAIYRAKNSFGALVKNENRLTKDIKNNTWSVY
jgi:hypothetical protein